MKRGYADLPLHSGRAPAWLFRRMARLASSLAEIMVIELGPEGFLERVADPFWFQCLGCVLGFDWHSSGLTTTTCGALKEGLRGRESDLNLFIAGGKGAASRKTPDQIMRHCERAGCDGDRLVYASRMSAKVDSSAVQDGYRVYHHSFFFTASGRWAVVQQGMNAATGRARRYHWLSGGDLDFVREPHMAVCSEGRGRVLNMTAREGEASRQAAAEAGRLSPEKVLAGLRAALGPGPAPRLELPARHRILREDIDPARLKKIFLATFEEQPRNFEALLGMRGVGAKTVRALCLVGELLYGAEPSFRDPARFSFAHGGKDGIPYPVDRDSYDRTCAVVEKAVARAGVGRREKLEAMRRLAGFLEPAGE